MVIVLALHINVESERMLDKLNRGRGESVTQQWTLIKTNYNEEEKTPSCRSKLDNCTVEVNFTY